MSEEFSGSILILSGPSGAGKSSLFAKLQEVFKDCYFSISHTTRAPRGSEKNGVEYYFVSREEFEKDIENNEFLEWANVHNNLYGTSKKPIEKALKEGKLVIFDIDVQGQENICKIYPNISTSVFVLPPSKTELQKRLESRGSDSKEVILARLNNAIGEAKKINNFDYLIVNDNLEKAAQLLINIAFASFHKASKIKVDDFLENWSK